MSDLQKKRKRKRNGYARRTLKREKYEVKDEK